MIRILLLAFVIVACLVFTGCDEAAIVVPECSIGEACDDSDNTTENDALNADCECVGVPNACTGIGDADGDGVCSDLDCDDNDLENTGTDKDGDGVCGDIDCDDNDPANTDVDADGDGYCSSVDCLDNAPSYYPGAPCDDLNPGTINDVVTTDCNCQGIYPYGSMTDPRDGQEYLTIDIGSLTWMAENLNYEAGASWCYDNDPINCTIYGRMYDIHTAIEACPVGWHLPTHTEWQLTINHLGGHSTAGRSMKAESDLWESPNAGASNSSGFSGLPGGCRSIVTGEFNMLTLTGFWWSITETGQGNNIYAPALNAFRNEVLEPDGHPGDAFSIRCVKD